MKQTPLHFILLFFIFSQTITAQNYLRVSDPDDWNAVISNQQGWHQWAAQGQFDEVRIIAEPQGIYTEIGFYATISPGPDAYSWQGEFEIIWQFDLPSNAIIHDSWLWIDGDIIKADVLDYWTALNTYEGIVDRNEDPSFLYQMADKRYELRIYPLFENESRTIKMSFLVPTEWNTQKVASDLLSNLIEGTTYLPDVVEIGMPVDDQWTNPSVKIDNEVTPLTETIIGGTGNTLHYIEVSTVDFINAEASSLTVDAPLSENQTFLSTYTIGNDQFYQLAYLPDWTSAIQNEGENTLIFLDYNAFTTSMGKGALTDHLVNTFNNHFSNLDAINVAVNTSNGVLFLSDDWWIYDANSISTKLTNLINAQNVIDLEQLLIKGFEWAQNQDQVDQIYLMVANEELVYPPIAEEVFQNIEGLVPINIPLSIIDYQDQNVSTIFYDNEEYEGNEYFYQLLSGAFTNAETILWRNSNTPYPNFLTQFFPLPNEINGIYDYSTSLASGIAYQRFELNNNSSTVSNQQVLLQTGKYVGDFPMQIEANLVTDDGAFFNVSSTIPASDIVPGDTLMREMWFGPYLKGLEAVSSSEEDIQAIIQHSITERVLTSLTAFLALEPSQGGEPCIDCLFNDGIMIVSVDDLQFDPEEASIRVNPNPITDHASIQMTYPAPLNPEDWNAQIFDATGRLVEQLDFVGTSNDNKTLEWEWNLNGKFQAGIYFCHIQSEFGKQIAKLVVVPN